MLALVASSCSDGFQEFEEQMEVNIETPDGGNGGGSCGSSGCN